MTKLLPIALIVTLMTLLSSPASAQQCVPVDHAYEDQAALNAFWGTSIPLCRIEPGSRNAYANRDFGVVLADQDWLDEMAGRYGRWAATGILAHEWGHMIQGPVGGTAAELQADCLAGVFMRGMGLPQGTVQQLAQSNFVAGDAEWSFGGHGTSQQRVNAALRGYNAFNGSHDPAYLIAICPLSAL